LDALRGRPLDLLLGFDDLRVGRREIGFQRSGLADIEEQMGAAEAVLQRTTIKAPAAGIVVSSTYNSTGSVIAPGEKIMEILPTASGLIVDAKLRPKDIDDVRV
ncbi:MAG: HlyD family efflux transporter periplasmic adaptor subunit, partial [Mesorhizobium sp.]